MRTQLRTSQAVAIVDSIVADSPVAQAKLELAHDLVADLQRLDAQRREVKRRGARAVAAAPTSIAEVYGVGPIVAACVLGYVRDIHAYYQRKRANGMTGKCALRALKRKISDTLYERMLHDLRRRKDPGGHSGNDAVSSAATRSHSRSPHDVGPHTPSHLCGRSACGKPPRSTAGRASL